MKILELFSGTEALCKEILEACEAEGRAKELK